MQRILVVEDDRVQIDVVSMLLRHAGYETIAASDARSAAQLFADKQPDLVILDVHLGDADGRDLLREFRKLRPEVLILMLTVLNAEDDRVRSLDSGADDYLAKPFGPRELIARVRALFRRGSAKTSELIPPRRMELGSVMLDPMTREVTRSGHHLDLSPTEFRLLQTLMTRSNTLVPTLTLLKEVWGHQDLTARNVLRVTANRLRAKLETDPANPRLLRTVSGEGLIFRCDESPAPPASNDLAAVLPEVITELQELVGDIGMQPLRQLSDVFAASAVQHIADMRSALANDQLPAIAEHAHRLAGSSATLGAQRLVQVCATIEEHARAGGSTFLLDSLRQLELELERFQAAIRPLLGQASE